MFEDSNIVTGLEIGTSKICVVIGEQKSSGTLNILGVGQAVSRGVRKGEIINPKAVEEDLREALSEAEAMCNVEIRSVYLGVTGNHVQGFKNRGFHRVVSPDREIFQEDVVNVLENAKAINLPFENTVIHSIRQFFTVDGEGGIVDPVGNHGSQLEVDLHVIHGKINRLQNSIRLTRSTSLDVAGIVFNGFASGLAMLTPEQKELGALVIDLGGGTTEYAVFSEGPLQYSGVLTVGGDHITNDLAYGLKLSLRRAEKLKREHGAAIASEESRGRDISVTDERGMEIRRVNAWNVQMIVGIRLEEIFSIINQKLDDDGVKPLLRAGVVLCGGTSRVPGIAALAEKVFQMNVTLGQPGAVQGFSQALNEPEFATAIGLVKYGALFERKAVAPPSRWAGLKGVIAKLLALLRGGSASGNPG